MHPRKVNLHLSLLLQLQLPIELRCIVIEDYFPFLPNERNSLNVDILERMLVEDDFYYSNYQMTNFIHYNCLISLSLQKTKEWMVNNCKSFVFELSFQHDNIYFVEPWRNPKVSRCRQSCNNKNWATHMCKDKLLLDGQSFRVISINVDEKKENVQKHLKTILQWYRNSVLGTIQC